MTPGVGDHSLHKRRLVLHVEALESFIILETFQFPALPVRQKERTYINVENIISFA